MKFISPIIFLIFTTSIFADDEIDSLLKSYQDESKLSKITKMESAGFLDIYTRDEMESMQAHTLVDVLRSIPGVTLSKTSDNLYTFKKNGSTFFTKNDIKFYLNNQEIISSFFNIPIEYVDHIEVYKQMSAVEFGSETTPLIIKLYTKKAAREEGGKIRLMASDDSYSTDLYQAQTLENGLSYLCYINQKTKDGSSFKRNFQEKDYTISDDSDELGLFSDLLYKGWHVDLGYYKNQYDTLLGIGDYKTPDSDNNVDSDYFYSHLDKVFDNDLELKLSYEEIKTTQEQYDENKITIKKTKDKIEIAERFNNMHSSKTFYSILNKRYTAGKNKLLLGSSYRHINTQKDMFTVKNDKEIKKYIKEIENIYAIYGENHYVQSNTFQFITSVRLESHRFVDSEAYDNEFIGRLSTIKNINDIQLKLFSSYIYSKELENSNYLLKEVDNNIQQVDEKVETISSYNYGIGIKKEIEKNILELIYSQYGGDSSYNIDGLFDSSSKSKSYDNSRHALLELKYKYIFNQHNKLYIDAYIGSMKNDLKIAPNQGINLRLFNQYEKFDIYNELLYKGSYSHYGIHMNPSYDYSVALKYHYSEDLSIGIKGNNIFDSGYKELYSGYDKSIAVIEQKFWINLEYLF